MVELPKRTLRLENPAGDSGKSTDTSKSPTQQSPTSEYEKQLYDLRRKVKPGEKVGSGPDLTKDVPPDIMTNFVR